VGVVQTNIQNLMHKEVSRKEFLGIGGLVLLSIFGFDTIIKLLTGKSLADHQSIHDYSTSGYGGIDGKASR
jgi:hypothetical protein